MKILIILLLSITLANCQISLSANALEKESRLFSPFLLEVEEKLSQYNVQSDVSRYNVVHLGDWGKVNKPQGISIDRNNFHQFLDKLNIRGEIKNVKITDSLLKALDKVLAITLRRTYKEIIDDSGDRIILAGAFIKFSDFLDKNGVFRNPSTFSSRIITIFATKTIFIDRSLTAVGNQLNISIVAPKWEVVGEQSINLGGENALFKYPQAEIGEGDGQRGAPGKQGLPGGAGGNFFGIGEVFINGDRLRIMADGGRGGPGQDGGNGAKGRDGQVVTIEQLNDRKFVSLNKKNDRIKVDTLWDRAADYGYQVQCGKGDNCFGPNKINCECGVWGKKGQRGGDGGMGGAGGVGGKAGKVDIEELGEDASEIKVYNGNGEVGVRGQGGLGGEGGNGNMLRVTYYQRAYFSVYWRTFEVSIGFLRDEPNDEKGLDGDRV